VIKCGFKEKGCSVSKVLGVKAAVVMGLPQIGVRWEIVDGWGWGVEFYSCPVLKKLNPEIA
jgi:hypothetical protein